MVKSSNSPARLVFVLLVIAVVAGVSAAEATFSGRHGYGRIGFRVGHPIVFAQPFSEIDLFTQGDYFGTVNAALEGGIGFSDYLELTIAVNVEFARWEHDDLAWLYGTGSAVVGVTGYFIPGNIRPYGRLDLGLSFHYADDDYDAPGYIKSLGFGLGVGTGCQFVLGDIFYLEPYFHWRAHLSPTFDFEVDDPRYTGSTYDYDSMPMSIHAGLGFGFLF